MTADSLFETTSIPGHLAPTPERLERLLSKQTLEELYEVEEQPFARKVDKEKNIFVIQLKKRSFLENEIPLKLGLKPYYIQRRQSFVVQGPGPSLLRPWGPLRERKCSHCEIEVETSFFSCRYTLLRPRLEGTPAALFSKPLRKRMREGELGRRELKTVSFRNFARPFRALHNPHGMHADPKLRVL
ncbi:hypothetical protein ALC60_12240 [Trachymyrmex zeteki]|uniref:Uncharacterized protein n=1 Tax=Mycetomoellerius zeteki TaxID=64791 RepID=A0A151WLJ6_9HYME|nr:hypothetical protein ALC60_12240 [Trachymyrmex zeteki]